jgi:hypothetical protein
VPALRDGHRRAAADGQAALAGIRTWYRAAVAKGIADNQGKRAQGARDGLRLARRFRDHQANGASPSSTPSASSSPPAPGSRPQSHRHNTAHAE